MFVRLKKNKGGSTSVILASGERVPGKKHVVSRIIKSFGYSVDEEEIQKLKEEALKYKAHLEAERVKIKTLKVSNGSDIRSCQSHNFGFLEVYGKIFYAIFTKIGLKEEALKRLSELVTMRIAEPASKRKTSIIGYGYNVHLKADTIYKLMDKVDKDIIEQIKQAAYAHTKKLLADNKEEVEVLFYDLTTLYFETNEQDAIRDFGFSKDGKPQHVQILLAMMVTKEGLPIGYECFPGNVYEGHTLIPILNRLREQYAISRVVLVADAALMSKINLAQLDRSGYTYIIAARLKNSTKAIKERVINGLDYRVIAQTKNNEGKVLEYISAKIIKSETSDKTNHLEQLVVYYSSSRARKDAHDRMKALEKIKGYIHSSSKKKLTACLKKSYVKISKGTDISIDEDKLELEKNFDGYFGLKTNITNPDPLTILNHYKGLWQVEETFRISKNNLEIRPIFHSNINRIHAHIAICYMALSLVRHLQFLLKKTPYSFTLDQIHILLSQMKKVTITDSHGNNFYLLEDPPLELIPVYQLLQLKWPKKFSCS